MASRKLFLDCGPYETFDPARGLQYRGAETGQTSMARAHSRNETWDRVVDNGLMLFRCLSEALFPGLAADGTLTVLHHFYDEYCYRRKMIVQVLKHTMFAGYEREGLCKDVTSFLRLRFKRTKRDRNNRQKASA
jgi:hypothetical protein